MKYIFTILVFLHGAIHILGFLKAFKFGKIEQLSISISRPVGVLWLIAFIFWGITGTSFILGYKWWYWITGISLIVSTGLIISAWRDAKFGTIPNIIILVLAAIIFFN